MKHVLSGAVALTFALGVAVSAQAQAPQGNAAQGNMGQSNTAQAPMRAAPQGAIQQSRVKYPKSHTAMVKEAQSRLKLAGFYKGKIDGRMGPKTKQALAQFEQQQGLPVTKQLNRRTFAALISTPVTGVGSSMPHRTAQGQANGMTRPMTGPAPTQAPGAGGPNGGAHGSGANTGANAGH